MVGEGTRCWFGNQFSLIAPRFAAYGVELWVPELGGQVRRAQPVAQDADERARRDERVRASARAGAGAGGDGRAGRQRGSAPGRAGAVRVHGGRRRSAPEPAQGGRGVPAARAGDRRARPPRWCGGSSPSTWTGNGDRAIAGGLNRDGVPCPSARRPDQNRHRLADGWQGSTVRAILENPRYTGYAVFGRWTKHEMLPTPTTWRPGTSPGSGGPRRRTSCAPATPAHPAIVSVEDVHPGAVAAADPRRRWHGRDREARTVRVDPAEAASTCCAAGSGARSAGGRCRAARSARTPTTGARARTLAPGSAALAEHPKTVNLREDVHHRRDQRVDRGAVRAGEPRRRPCARWSRRRAIRPMLAVGEPRGGGWPTPRRG